MQKKLKEELEKKGKWTIVFEAIVLVVLITATAVALVLIDAMERQFIM